MNESNKMSAELIERLAIKVQYAELEGEEMNDVSWGMQEGTLISFNEAKLLVEYFQQTQSLQKQIEVLKQSNKILQELPNAKVQKEINEEFEKSLQSQISQKDEMLEDLINQVHTNHIHLQNNDKHYPHSVLKIHNEQILTQYQNSKK